MLPILITLFLILQYRLWFGEGSFAQKVELTRAVEQQKARNERLTERNRILAEEVDGLRNDPGAIEERARADLGMIHNDETFFLVLEKRQQQPAKRPRDEEMEQEETVDSIPEGLFEE